MRFTPGQSLELHLPPDTAGGNRTRKGDGKGDGKGIRRVFSLTSAPGAPLLTIGVGTAEPVSSAKRSLLALAPGDGLTATTVNGDFLLPRNPATPVLLIAAGIGITPYMAQLAAASAGSSAGTQPGTATLTAMLSCCTWQRMPPSWATPRSCSAPGRASWPGLPTVRRRRPSWRTQAHRRIDAAALKELVPDIGGREVFVSGSPASVRSLRAAARGAGARRIHVDSFTGY